MLRIQMQQRFSPHAKQKTSLREKLYYWYNVDKTILKACTTTNPNLELKLAKAGIMLHLGQLNRNKGKHGITDEITRQIISHVLTFCLVLVTHYAIRLCRYKAMLSQFSLVFLLALGYDSTSTSYENNAYTKLENSFCCQKHWTLSPHIAVTECQFCLWVWVSAIRSRCGTVSLNHVASENVNGMLVLTPDTISGPYNELFCVVDRSAECLRVARISMMCTMNV